MAEPALLSIIYIIGIKGILPSSGRPPPERALNPPLKDAIPDVVVSAPMIPRIPGVLSGGVLI